MFKSIADNFRKRKQESLFDRLSQELIDIKNKHASTVLSHQFSPEFLEDEWLLAPIFEGDESPMHMIAALKLGKRMEECGKNFRDEHWDIPDEKGNTPIHKAALIPGALNYVPLQFLTAERLLARSNYGTVPLSTQEAASYLDPLRVPPDFHERRRELKDVLEDIDGGVELYEQWKEIDHGNRLDRMRLKIRESGLVQTSFPPKPNLAAVL